MIGLDTNLLLYARVAHSPFQRQAETFLESLSDQTDVAISELVLIEFYNLLRNPAVMDPPMSPARAVDECMIFRRHPRWRLVESADVMNRVWPIAAAGGFPRRRIFDLRLAFTLQAHGVTEFATANVKDFVDLGFDRVWNPLEGG